MAIRIRVDDFPGTKPEEFYRHNLENFKQFHALIPKKYLLGVIPTHTSEGDLLQLGAQNIEIGMHGVFHDERYPNEFREYQTQIEIEKILAAQRNHMEHLSGKEIRVYMPPHNVIDMKTLFALENTGFKAFTSGPETNISEQMHLSIKRLHSTSPLEYGRSDELLQRGSVEYLQEEAKKRTVYLTLHWPWEWNIGLNHLKLYLSQIEHLIEDFDVG